MFLITLLNINVCTLPERGTTQWILASPRPTPQASGLEIHAVDQEVGLLRIGRLASQSSSPPAHRSHPASYEDGQSSGNQQTQGQRENGSAGTLRVTVVIPELHRQVLVDHLVLLVHWRHGNGKSRQWCLLLLLLILLQGQFNRILGRLRLDLLVLVLLL